MTKKELAERLNRREYGDSFSDVLEEAKASGLVIVTGISVNLIKFDGALCDQFDCLNDEPVYFDKDGVSQDGTKRANVIEAVWCDGTNSDGIPAEWTYKTDIPHEEFNIWEAGELYCVGIVFSIEDLM